MLNIQETFNKFNYYPNDLKNNSTKYVIVICENCKQNREIQYRSFNLHKPLKCYTCATKYLPQRTPRTLFKKEEISLDILITLLYKGSTQIGRRYLRLGNGLKNLNINQTLNVYELIKLRIPENDKDVSNIKFKLALLDYLSSLDNNSKNYLIYYIFKNLKNVVLHGTEVKFCDRNGYVYKLINNTNIIHLIKRKTDYRVINANLPYKGKTIRVRQGHVII
jgi:hypothetical protein